MTDNQPSTDDGDRGPDGLTRNERIAKWAAECVDAMDPELRDECYLLAAIEPGLRCEFALDGRLMELSWVGRKIGVATSEWINTGTPPDDVWELMEAYGARPIPGSGEQ